MNDLMSSVYLPFCHRLCYYLIACENEAGGVSMPEINIYMLSGRTKAQKAEMTRVITEAVARIAKTEPHGVRVLFREFDRDNWATAGALMADRQSH